MSRSNRESFHEMVQLVPKAREDNRKHSEHVVDRIYKNAAERIRKDRNK